MPAKTEIDEKNGDEIIFAEETPKDETHLETGAWKIMIADDEQDVHFVTKMVLEDLTIDKRGFTFLSAYSAKEAKELMREHPDTALILLDVVMETISAGLDVVNTVRNTLNNKLVRIILRTGQPGHAPEVEIIKKYDINDYKLKTVLTDHTLFTAVITAVRSYRDLKELEESRNKLDLALEDARAAQRARAQFMANMQHELKTPLNGVLGAVEVLNRTEATEKQKKYFDIIKTAGEGLLEIISNVLDLTDMEEGRVVLNNEPFSLRETIRDIVKTLQIQAKWKNLQIYSFIDNDVPDRLNGDCNRLRQVLMNLIINAIKYTFSGCIALNISLLDKRNLHESVADKEDKARVSLLFEVNDTGIGVKEEKQEKIFEPFMVGENIMTKQLAGAGLGLAISKDIIEKMNGSIWLDSEPDLGSTFYFSVEFQMEKNGHVG